MSDMSLRISIITISDRAAAGERTDESGPALSQVVQANGWQVTRLEIVPDDQSMIEHKLAAWADEGTDNVILTTGGTGFSRRDVTPEATLAVIDRQAPGLAEAMRAVSLQATPHAMLSRAIAGIRGSTLIVNLPGSPKAAIENFQVILPILAHAVQLLSDDPNAESGHSIVKH